MGFDPQMGRCRLVALGLQMALLWQPDFEDVVLLGCGVAVGR